MLSMMNVGTKRNPTDIFVVGLLCHRCTNNVRFPFYLISLWTRDSSSS